MRMITMFWVWLALATGAEAQTAAVAPPLKLSAGLEASVTIAARQKGGNYMSVAMQIENKGKLPVALALIGPVPVAVDNAGVAHTMTAFSGATACRELTVGYLPMCLLGEEVSGYRYPILLEAMTQIDPGAAITLTFQLNGRESTGNLMSFSSVFAYRIIADPLKDATMTEAERRRQLRTLNVSFPSFPFSTQR